MLELVTKSDYACREAGNKNISKVEVQRPGLNVIECQVRTLHNHW